MLNDEQMLLMAMCLVQPKEDYILQNIRTEFMKRDRAWSEFEALAEYRHREAKAIIDRWKQATMRAR